MSYPFTAEQLCLQNLARQTWLRRGAAKKHGLPLGEETITEDFLLDLATSYPGKIIIVPFTKHAEGKLGSDWAWSFENSSQSFSFSMMIQAKTLHVSETDYIEIGRKIGKSKVRQIDRFLKVSKRLSLPAYYAFYNHLSDGELHRLPNNCRSLQIIGQSPVSELWGISIAHAADVLAALPDQSFNAHSQHSIPLHCLLCSHATGVKGPFGTPGDIARRLSAQKLNIGDQLAPSEIPQGLRKGTHPIFRMAEEANNLEGHESASNLIDTLRKEFPGVAGVVIFRDRDTP